MEVFTSYLASIESPEHRERAEEVLQWIVNKYPSLEPVIKWNTPMFSDHGTFIIGLSTAKNHMSITPEAAGITHFASDIKEAGYTATQGLFRIKWSEPVNYELLKKMIEFNIQDKVDHQKFWR